MRRSAARRRLSYHSGQPPALMRAGAYDSITGQGRCRSRVACTTVCSGPSLRSRANSVTGTPGAVRAQLPITGRGTRDHECAFWPGLAPPASHERSCPRTAVAQPPAQRDRVREQPCPVPFVVQSRPLTVLTDPTVATGRPLGIRGVRMPAPVPSFRHRARSPRSTRTRPHRPDAIARRCCAARSPARADGRNLAAPPRTPVSRPSGSRPAAQDPSPCRRPPR
jgi:hypothetical protein